jgi:hypothetical protein
MNADNRALAKCQSKSLLFRLMQSARYERRTGRLLEWIFSSESGRFGPISANQGVSIKLLDGFLDPFAKFIANDSNSLGAR